MTRHRVLDGVPACRLREQPVSRDSGRASVLFHLSTLTTSSSRRRPWEQRPPVPPHTRGRVTLVACTVLTSNDSRSTHKAGRFCDNI